MNKPGAKGVRRIINATGYSMNGFKQAWKSEAAFRQELMLSVVMVPLGLYLGQGPIEKALLAGSLFIVLITEIINTAIEAVVDRFGGEHHELSGLAKDLGSAAVFVALSLTALIWVLLLLPEAWVRMI